MIEKYCPICNSLELKLEFKLKYKPLNYETLQYFSCKNCNYFFRIPCNLFIDYHTEYVNNDFISKSKNLAKNYYNYTKENLKNKKNLLEIGGSLGYFCKIINENTNINTLNYELSDFSIEYSNSINVKSTNNIDNLEPESFDIIISFHVFEHIPPNEIILLLEKLINLLKVNGKIIIITPNAKSNKLKLFKSKYVWLAPLEHIGFLDGKTFKYLLDNIKVTNELNIILKSKTKIPSFFHYPIISFLSNIRNKSNTTTTHLIEANNKTIENKKSSFKSKIIITLKKAFHLSILIEKLVFIPFYFIYDIFNKEHDELVVEITKNAK